MRTPAANGPREPLSGLDWIGLDWIQALVTQDELMVEEHMHTFCPVNSSSGDVKPLQNAESYIANASD